MSSKQSAHTDRAPDGAAGKRRFSPALLISGLLAVAIAVWGAAGGVNVASAGTLFAIGAIGAVAVAGLMLIVKPGRADSATGNPGAADDD